MTNEITPWEERVLLCPTHNEITAAMEAEIAELRAKVESLAADAGRYKAFFSAGLPICFMGNDYNNKADLDAAIDAYRAKEKA